MESHHELVKSQIEKFLTPEEASEMESSMLDYKESVAEIVGLTEKFEILNRSNKQHKVTIVLDPRASG